MKENFEISKNCNSRFSSNNLVGHFLNTVISLVNQKNYLPQYVVIALEDDILEMVQFTGKGLAQVVGKVLEFLATEINEVFEWKFDLLPIKAKPVNRTQIYWVTLPPHVDFYDVENRIKFNLTLESMLKLYRYMTN